MWQPAGVRIRRPAALVLGLVTVAVPVAGCRTSPSVAAYVGDEQVTVAELRSAVDDRLADPAIAEAAGGGGADYTRQVLTLLVRERVYAAAAEEYDVEVTDAELGAFITQALGGQDEESLYAQAAGQGYSREDVRESARQQLLRRELGQATGQGDALSEAALRARYEEARAGLEQAEVGYFVVPDQAAADAAVAELTAAPASYPAVAARFPGQNSLPQVESTPVSEVSGPLAQGITAAAPGTGFTTTVPGVDGVVVVFVATRTTPTFEEARPDLESQAANGVEEAGAAVVGEVQDELSVTVNPRYGTLEDDVVQEADGGVVQLLDEAGTEAGAPAPATGEG
ncbi:peptidyl-prolyl cis-trans isomerase SurA [Geodermatophilus nigrescens]|uniref:Peptidyl-prolyl cis-trans isomerase SurA n=1 Tax=Geodermatophilus nigrescens TaxID=1070870 RepID=A0A1M5E5N8_9ACTN|nr:peptidyl-prolyl cis-trans isomerase SurA [Geodermatophilus nigrescens]